MSRTDAVGVAEVLDALPTAVVLVDATRRISAWNAAAEVLYGHDRMQVVGAPLLEVLFDEDDRRAAAALLDCLAADRWDGDFRVRRRDGALLVSSFRLAALGPGAGWAWIATDGLDQGLAEQERSVLLSAEHAARSTAEEALGLIEAILASAPVGIAVFDLELRYVRVNDAYAALSGVPAADHVGAPLDDVLPLQADVGADLRRVVTTGRTILGRHVELGSESDEPPRYFTVSYFPVRTTAGVVGAGLTLAEVTDAKRAEAERAALLRSAEVAHQRLSILATASTVLTTTMELDELLGRLTRVLAPIAADWCVIELIGRGGEVEHVAVSHRNRAAADELTAFLRSTSIDLAAGGPVAEVVRTGQARLTQRWGIDELLDEAVVHDGGDVATAFSLRSSVVVPIEARGKVHGVLILSTEGDRSFDDDDLDLAVEIAHRAALAVENARAFQQEHQIAESLQRALLPSTLPAPPRLDLAVRYVAATDGAFVGGDWYDVMAFDDGTTGLVVGDVVGHDIAASTSMGQLRSALRAYACEDHTAPAAAVARVDKLFDSLGLTYATCIFGVVDPIASTFRWSNAGHPPPLLVRDGTASFLAEGNGVLLGVTGGDGVQEAAVELRAGDLLVLYTDGLVERRSASLQAGLDLLAAVAAAAPADVDALCDTLVTELVPREAALDDDVALLVARLRPEEAPLRAHRLAFEAKPESAALTRGFAAGVLDGAGWGAHVDTAVLLVNELVTNAIRHARGPCALVVTVEEDRVEVSVEDGEPEATGALPADRLGEYGRGLLLVEALADEWGVRPLAGGSRGKATWFALRAGPGASDQPA